MYPIRAGEKIMLNVRSIERHLLKRRQLTTQRKTNLSKEARKTHSRVKTLHNSSEDFFFYSYEPSKARTSSYNFNVSSSHYRREGGHETTAEGAAAPTLTATSRRHPREPFLFKSIKQNSG